MSGTRPKGARGCVDLRLRRVGAISPHSPVVLIEYDNHPGIFLNNDEPEPFHVHTIVRTPNGGDYGKDLLRQHYAEHHHQGDPA